jgi:hypothetical protein
MNEKINLKEIARKAYTSYHQDTVVDVSIALVILAFSIMIIVDLPWLGGIIGVLAMSFYAGMKKVLTVPRIGYVKFPQQRAKRINAGLMGLALLALALGMVAFMQTAESGAPPWLIVLIENYMLTIGLLVSALFLLAGYTFRIKRMYAYALLTLVMFVAGHFIYFPLQYYLTALGTLILLIGLVMMIRFVRKYPKATETMDE